MIVYPESRVAGDKGAVMRKIPPAAGFISISATRFLRGKPVQKPHFPILAKNAPFSPTRLPKSGGNALNGWPPKNPDTEVKNRRLFYPCPGPYRPNRNGITCSFFTRR